MGAAMEVRHTQKMADDINQTERSACKTAFSKEGILQRKTDIESDRDIDMQDAPLPMPGAFGPDTRLTASPSGSASGRDREGDPKTSGERNRSRTRNGRTASGQLRMCKKCGEPLTGQFVRALGGTFHLDCFKCRVCILTVFACVAHSLTVWLYRIAGK